MAAAERHAGINAWQLAVEQYLASLPDPQRAAFKAPANADTCLNMIIRAQGRKRGFTRLMELIRPLIDPLKRFEGAIDVLIQTHGAVASPIWGPLRMAITIASDHFKTLESLAMVLHRVISSLERFTNYENIFRDDLAVQKAIGALYSDLIDFCTRVVRYHSRSSLRAAMVSFDKEFREVSDRINLHSAQIDHVANAANIAESKKARETEELNRQLQLRNNIQRWLSPSNVQDDLYRHRLQYMPGSCDWILKTPHMQTCLDLTFPTAMRIQGRPGTGKTVLTSFLVNYLEEQKRLCVLYFFCKAGDVEKREATPVIRTLLGQLLHHDHPLYAHLEPYYTKSGRATADSFVDVCACFRLALSNTSQRQIYIIVDALDECENVEDLLGFLFHARSSASAQISLIFSSRSMQLSFPLDEDMRIESGSTNQPIGNYVCRRVSEMKTLSLSDDKLRMMVVDQVSGAADGLWLYARLMLDEIERLPSAALIRRHLRTVPHGLTQLYTQILRSKENSFSDIDLMFAQQIYLWLDVNDYIPSFLYHDCLTYETLSLVLQKVNFGQPVFDPIRLVSDLCSPLIRATDVIGNGFTALLQDYEITSTHHTADQYIRESQQMPMSSLPLILRPRKLRQLHRGITGIWYFTGCKLSEERLLWYRENPYDLTYGSYFEMAYGIWGALKLASIPPDLDSEEMAVAIKLLQELTEYIDASSGRCLRWVESAIIINYAGKWTQLLENAVKGVAILQKQGRIDGFPAFESYRLARLTFLYDYMYVLRLTGPGEYHPKDQIPMPVGFLGRPLAVQMLEIGRRWQYLHGSSTERMFSMEMAVARIQRMQETVQDLTLEDIQELKSDAMEHNSQRS